MRLSNFHIPDQLSAQRLQTEAIVTLDTGKRHIA